MEKVARKVEGIGEKLSEILSESMGEEWGEDQKVKKKRGEKEAILSIFRYNNNQQNQFDDGGERENEERENDESVMMSLHIPAEHCQFSVNPHPQGSFCFDSAADTIVVTIGKQLQVILSISIHFLMICSFIKKCKFHKVYQFRSATI